MRLHRFVYLQQSFTCKNKANPHWQFMVFWIASINDVCPNPDISVVGVDLLSEGLRVA